MNVTIVGRGKVGTTLRSALETTGPKPQLLQGRAERLRVRSDAELIVLAVPDGVIAEVAGRLRAPRGASVVHVAGSRGLDDLVVLRSQGLSLGVMHPLASFATKRGPSLSGVSFVFSGDRAAKRRVRDLCERLGARFITPPAQGPAYHAASALLANGSAALADAAQRVLLSLGWKERPARTALAGLLRTVADNVERVGVPDALTGPVVRGDGPTVRRHLRALASLGPAHVRAYSLTVPLILACAARAGLSQRDQARIRAVVSAESKRPRR